MALATAIIFVLFLMAAWIIFERLKGVKLSFSDGSLDTLRHSLQNLEYQTEHLADVYHDLEEQAGRQFLLYEVTKEMAKSLTEEEAFEIFQKYLRKHCLFETCRLTSLADGAGVPAPRLHMQVFYIQGEEDTGSFLEVEGVDPQDREKVSVLGHQFALAFRRVQLYKQWEQMAVSDDLTGLFTRRYILANLEMELERVNLNQGRMAFVMIDVDHFKRFNDQHGHLAGDQILRQAAAVIHSGIREVDIAGRFGGEEFCVILPNTGLDGAKLTAERIRRAVKETVVRAFGKEFSVTVSLGAALFPEHGRTAEELVDHADQALYKAKHEGRDRVCVFETSQG